MDKKTANTAEGALIKVQKLIEDDEITVFSRDEARALQEMAKVWGQIKAVVTLGGIIGNSLKWLVMMAAAWMAFKSGLVGMIQAALGK